MELYCIKGQEGEIEPQYAVLTGKIYNLIDKKVCSCGVHSVDVGIRFDSSKLNRVICICGEYNFTDVAWKLANRFIPIDNIDISELVEPNEEIFV